MSCDFWIVSSHFVLFLLGLFNCQCMYCKSGVTLFHERNSRAVENCWKCTSPLQQVLSVLKVGNQVAQRYQGMLGLQGFTLTMTLRNLRQYCTSNQENLELGEACLNGFVFYYSPHVYLASCDICRSCSRILP
jgi:hypothetical protein